MPKERDSRLDLIRTIAILMICLNHAISSIYVDQINFELYNSIPIPSKLFMNIFYIVSRLGVPLFLFLTGALVLNKKFKNFDDIKKFYKSNLLSLLITTEIWNILYYIINIAINKQSFNFLDLIQILTFTKSSVFGHMWYMPMIIGMYIFIPFVSIIVQKFKLKQLTIPIIIVVIYSFIFPYLNLYFFTENINIEFQALLNTAFSGAQYGLYIILGYYIYSENLYKKGKVVLLLFCSLISFVLAVMLQHYLYIKETNVIIYYNSIWVLIFSVCIYMVLLRTKNKENKITQYLSKNSLAVFYIHFPILVLLSNYVHFTFGRPFVVIFYYIASICISLIIITLFKRIKILKKYLLRQ